jgi:exopolysaccharide biosynthesis polyprenyl glycosylphosphotransferase
VSFAIEGNALDYRLARVDEHIDDRAGRWRRARTPWRRLACAELFILLAAWALADSAFSVRLATVPPIAAAGLCLIAWQRLYGDDVADMRAAELRGLWVVSLRLGAVAAAVTWALGEVSPGAVATGSALSLAGLVATRVAYRAWLRNARAAGRFTRPIVLVGIDGQALATRRRLDERPELGFTVAAAFGSRRGAHRFGLDDIWAGDLDDAPTSRAIRSAHAALVSTTALEPEEVDPIVGRLLRAGRGQVHLSTGTTFVDQRRLRPVNVDYGPVVRVQGLRRRRAQRAAKRALDVGLGSLALVLSLPVLVAAAAAIKLGDRGPILFRQARVGRGGHPFTVYKLRTMTVDAEARLAHLDGHNERVGPLFKMEQDPRVTRVGSLIRHLSIDELPQLWNVIKGEMSLVGPRPALPEEFERFDDRLRQRCRMRPGMTGLWQAEARDNPSFLTYERLDLFYVENWSLGLDLTVLVATVESELARVAKLLRPRVRTQPRSRPAERPAGRPRLEAVAGGRTTHRTRAGRVRATRAGKGTTPRLRVAMVGTRGVPARYGGFETAVEEIGRRLVARGHEVTVYSRKDEKGSRPPSEHLGMDIVTLPALRLRSAETLSHSVLSSLHVLLSRRHDAVFVFNSANAVLLPLLRARRLPVAVHVDGLEWRRAKWAGSGARYYRRAESLAVRWADALIADAPGIAEYYDQEFGAETELLSYGAPVLDDLADDGLDELGVARQKFHLVVARFEPENHVDLIVRGYRESTATYPLVVVGGAPYSDEYTAAIRDIAASDDRIRLVGSVWDQEQLNQLYGHALLYLHGHSVGGTNPSLLRAMGAGAAVGAYDVRFNRDVIGGDGWFFSDETDIARLVEAAETNPDRCWAYGTSLQAQVAAHHRWDAVADGYEALAHRLADGFSRMGEATGRRLRG